MFGAGMLFLGTPLPCGLMASCLGFATAVQELDAIGPQLQTCAGSAFLIHKGTCSQMAAFHQDYPPFLQVRTGDFRQRAPGSNLIPGGHFPFAATFVDCDRESGHGLIRGDVPQCMAAADVFALPSRWEGLPMVLLEALVMGAPVVATRVEGVDEVITDGENGLLIASEDAVGLAEALLRLLEDAELRGKLSRAGQACVRAQYTVDTMCAQYARWLTPAFQEDTDDMDAA